MGDEMKQPLSPPSKKRSSSHDDTAGDDSPSNATAKRPPRESGLDAPYSRDQFISCGGHVLSGGAFFTSMGCLVVDTTHVEIWTWIVLCVHVAVNGLLLCAWISCETCNPGDVSSSPSSWLGMTIRGPRWEKTRYCAVCRKSVPGMDHHCTWLNTCIGQRNYAQFFTIAMCGVVVFSIQAVVSVYAIEWRRDSMSPSLLAHSGFIVCAVLSVPCLVMYSTLLAFHIYLSCVGYGTYDYFLKRRDALRAERRRKRDEQIQATKESIDKLTRVV
ncbi:hypothetical protein LEN26_014271 [Aphanomyces euteiches]|nr:hypothetical protein AeMF1_017473 [Aphanomyces euteiches]KAH9107505.1 hypothetical protein LEN26_014271 [Aphanomyces euteiches]KAH9192453.1 hypothetical protein AeNC1_005570 [Aphanomyces euteiches]